MKFLKKLWNLFLYLFLFILVVVCLFAFITTNRDLVLYKKYGKVTLASIDNYYEETKSHNGRVYDNKYYIDYSFSANGTIYKIAKHRISSTKRLQIEKINSIWVGKKIGDKFEVAYLEQDPNKNKILSELGGKELFFAYIAFILASAIIAIFINSLSLNGYRLIYYKIIAFVFLEVVITMHVINGIFPMQFILLFISIFLIKIVTDIKDICIWKNREYTTTSIESCEITNKTFSTETFGRFMRLYTYEYKDKYGGLHFGKRFICLLFGKKYNVGDKIRIVYNAKKPSQHLCLGKI